MDAIKIDGTGETMIQFSLQLSVTADIVHLIRVQGQFATTIHAAVRQVTENTYLRIHWHTVQTSLQTAYRL